MSSLILTIEEIASATHGQIINKNENFIYNISTDSRSVQKGDLFIPLVGEKHDAHSFLPEVLKKLPACVLTAKPIESKNVSVIQVADTLKALQDLAKYYRKKHAFKIIGITGSNGKTTSKFFTQAVLSQKFKTFASLKSFNNHFGVPLTLLSLTPGTEIGICEIGMNHPGEISKLTALAEPDISVCTTVGRAHLQDFGKVDGIYNEKKDIYSSAPAHNLRVFNLDNEWTFKMYENFKSDKNITFSEKLDTADVQFQVEEMSLSGLKIKGRILLENRTIDVPVFGKHNVTNLMVAASVALLCGMTPSEIWKALPLCKTVWGRGQMVPLKSQAHLVFDGYNANPDSVTALIKNISDLKVIGKKVLILGDMLEMGESGPSLHSEIGRIAGQSFFDVIVFVGQYASAFEAGLKESGFLKKSYISNTYEDSLASKIANMIQPNDVVVIKGSRGSKMERFIPFLNPLEGTFVNL